MDSKNNKQALKSLRQMIVNLKKDEVIPEAYLSELKTHCLNDANLCKEVESFLHQLLDRFVTNNRPFKAQSVRNVLETLHKDSDLPITSNSEGAINSDSSDSWDAVEKEDNTKEPEADKPQKPKRSGSLKKNVRIDSPKHAEKRGRPASLKNSEEQVEQNTDKSLNRSDSKKRSASKMSQAEREELKRQKQVEKERANAIKAEAKAQKQAEKNRLADEKKAAKEQQRLEHQKAKQQEKEAKQELRNMTPKPAHDSAKKERSKSRGQSNESPKQKKPDVSFVDQLKRVVPLTTCAASRFKLGEKAHFPPKFDFVFYKKPVNQFTTEDYEQLENDICSLLNTKGGKIFFGINSDQVPVGDSSNMRDFEKLALRVSLLVQDGIYPQVPFKHISIEILPVEGSVDLHLVRLNVNNGEKSRFYCTSKGSYYFRSQNLLEKHTPEQVQTTISQNAIKLYKESRLRDHSENGERCESSIERDEKEEGRKVPRLKHKGPKSARAHCKRPAKDTEPCDLPLPTSNSVAQRAHTLKNEEEE